MKKYIKWAVVFVLACGAAGYAYATFFHTTTYTSRAQLIVLAPKTVNQPKDYASLATSRSSIESVREKLNLSDSVESLQKAVVATNVVGTNIVTLEVTTSDAKKSQGVADGVAEAIGQQAKVLFGDNNTSVVDPASEGRPVGSSNPLKTAFLGALAGVFILGAIAFIFYDPKKEVVRKGTESEADVDAGAAQGIYSISSDTEAAAAAFEEPVEIKKVGYKYSSARSSKKDSSTSDGGVIGSGKSSRLSTRRSARKSKK